MKYTLKTISKETATSKESATSQCRHYWLIESSKGPTSKGVCKFCGMKRDFNNYWSETPPESDTRVSRTRTAEATNVGESESEEESRTPAART